MEEKLGDDEGELPQLRINGTGVIIASHPLLLFLGFPTLLGLLQLLLLLLHLLSGLLLLLLQLPLLLLLLNSQLLLSQLLLPLSLRLSLLMLSSWSPRSCNMPLMFLRRLVLVMVVNCVVVVIVVEHEPLHQLVKLLLELLPDRGGLANCCQEEEEAKAGLSHLSLGMLD